MTLVNVPNKVLPPHDLATTSPKASNQGILVHVSDPMGIPEMRRNARAFDLSLACLNVAPINPFARCR